MEDSFSKQLNNQSENLSLKQKYSQALISMVWARLAKEGLQNADDLIGTRETIESTDFEKFWKNVKIEDIDALISHYKKEIENQRSIYDQYGEAFVPELGVFSNNDTSFFEQKINDLETLKLSL